MRAELYHRAEQPHGRISTWANKNPSLHSLALWPREQNAKNSTPVASLFDLGLGFKGLGAQD